MWKSALLVIGGLPVDALNLPGAPGSVINIDEDSVEDGQAGCGWSRTGIDVRKR